MQWQSQLTNHNNQNPMFAANFSPEEEDITFSGLDSSHYAGPKVSMSEAPERLDSSRSSPNDTSAKKTAG